MQSILRAVSIFGAVVALAWPTAAPARDRAASPPQGTEVGVAVATDSPSPETWIGDLRILRQEQPLPQVLGADSAAALTTKAVVAPLPKVVAIAPRPAPPLRRPIAPPRPPAPPPAIVVASAQQSLINADRRSLGLAGLSWSSCLSSIAAQQARAMAGAGQIFHGSGVNQDWGCHLGSRQTGENVGVWGAGANDGAINSLFMASAPHRANIMGPYHYVGTAWVVGANGNGYIAIEFA